MHSSCLKGIGSRSAVVLLSIVHIQQSGRFADNNSILTFIFLRAVTDDYSIYIFIACRFFTLKV